MLKRISNGCLISCLLAMCTMVFGQSELPESADSTQKHVAVSEPIALLDRVTVFLGKPASSVWKISGSKAVIKMLDSADLNAPEYIGIPEGMRLYEVLVKDVPVGAETIVDSRDFQILIDSSTGQLCRIESTRPSYHEKVAKGLFTERPMVVGKYEFGSWEEIGTPFESPRMDLNEALSAVPGSLARVDKLRARFLTMKHPENGTKQMWVIETWGGSHAIMSVPPGHKSPELSPVDATYLTTLVDTESKLAISGGGRAIVEPDN